MSPGPRPPRPSLAEVAGAVRLTLLRESRPLPKERGPVQVAAGDGFGYLVCYAGHVYCWGLTGPLANMVHHCCCPFTLDDFARES